jgi:hypothetical protein
MSEYQYYEFQAIDKPLTAKQMAELRSYSTRAQITPASFINEYNWATSREIRTVGWTYVTSNHARRAVSLLHASRCSGGQMRASLRSSSDSTKLASHDIWYPIGPERSG